MHQKTLQDVHDTLLAIIWKHELTYNMKKQRKDSANGVCEKHG